MSPYSGDGKLYSAAIKKLTRSPVGEIFALVKFDGYSDEELEEVNIKDLQKIRHKEVKENGNAISYTCTCRI